MKLIEIDGNAGGGQMLRTALAMSMVTNTPFRMINIRKTRKDPGLKNQHLHAIKILQALSDSKADGARLGSEEILFIPAAFKRRSLKLDIGTAGSLSLLIQALLPAMILDEKKFALELSGGTDVSFSPSIDYIVHILLPHLKKYADIQLKVIRRGYHPKGQGVIKLTVQGKYTKETAMKAPAFDMHVQGHLLHIKGIAHASHDLQEAMVAERMANSASFLLNEYVPSIVKTYDASASPGCGITLWAMFSLNPEDINELHPIRLGADVLGERAKKAEIVGEECARKLLEEISFKAPADMHLGDMLVPYIALFGGSYTASKITDHTKTNVAVVNQFMDAAQDQKHTLRIEGRTVKKESDKTTAALQL